MVQDVRGSRNQLGSVSAYDLKGDQVRGSGFPYGKPTLPGRG